MTGSENYTNPVNGPFTCSVTDQVTITTLDLPDVELGPDVVLCTDDTYPIIQTIPTAKFADWTHGVTSIGSSWSVNSATYGVGTYSASVTSRDGCIGTDEMTVSLDPSATLDPIFDLSPVT